MMPRAVALEMTKPLFANTISLGEIDLTTPYNTTFMRLFQDSTSLHFLPSTKNWNLGAAGIRRALRRAKSVFQEAPEIKKGILSAIHK